MIIRLTTLFFSLLLCFQATAQVNLTLENRVDRNVELMSIVWRLAGAEEYSQTLFKRYTNGIEEHFGEYRKHELVRFARSIREENGIGYDAVASMAIHLDGNLNLKQGLADSSLEGRWANVDKERFTTLLKQFAADTRFDEFFAANTELYNEAVKRFMPIYEAIDLGWYADFFGAEPKEKFVIVNALGNDGVNYGPSIEYSDGRKEVFAIMGTGKVDDGGMVVFSQFNDLFVLIHEFNHSFVNPLTTRHRDILEDSGERLFAVIGEQMRGQAYASWESMMNEALCNAIAVKYMREYGIPQEGIDFMINTLKRRGFGWIEPLVAELDKYDAAHEEYPTLDDYMPHLAEAYREWVEKIEAALAAQAAATASNATN